MRLLVAFALLVVASAATAQPISARQPDVIYVPTPQEVVDEMLKLAKVGKGDVLYDLGSGDGRIPVTAAKRYGIRAYGIDIDPQRIAEANSNARKNGVTDLVQFKNEDLFKTQFSDATVVTLYLLPDLNVKLRPRLIAELKPGTRIVSHQFDMGTWKPDRTLELNGRTIYLWTVPPRKGS
ncbi:MAG: class I SAM-dependent methyltransferase [Burkholderiales bacterium]